MQCLYYPGCSLKGTAIEYDISTRRFLTAMEVELIEVEDWTCCGATAADAVSELLGLVLPARNLALAQRSFGPCRLVVPCSACYLNLKKAAEKIHTVPSVKERVNAVLAVEDLALEVEPQVHHLLELLTVHLDLKKFAAKVCRPLKDLVVAPYYGCQALRPFALFDDPEKPRSMEPLLLAAGARIHSWIMGGKCCGASNMTTHMEVGLELSGAILAAAKGADVIATVCPVCQINLEAYQHRISRLKGEDLSISVLYLPQLLGLCLGIAPQELGMGFNLAMDARIGAWTGA